MPRLYAATKATCHMTDSPTTISAILRRLSRGETGAIETLIPLVYDELRRIAHRHLQGEQAGHTLSTTALVHEAYLKLLDIRQVDWQDRNHFFAVSARLMRRILIDYARSRNRGKRGAGAVHVPLEDALDFSIQRADELVALDEALVRLEAQSERHARVVEYRCFGGLSVEETAEVLGTSPATVKRDWTYARAWLNRELGDA